MTTFTPDEHGHWVDGIGRLILSFAGIESAVLALVRQFSLSKIHGTAAQLTLQNKLDLLLEIVRSSEGNFEALTSALKSAKRLTKQRNLVAHNRLAVGISVSPDMKLHFREFIPSKRNEEVQLTLPQLLSAAEEAHQVERFLWSQVRGSASVT